MVPTVPVSGLTSFELPGGWILLPGVPSKEAHSTRISGMPATDPAPTTPRPGRAVGRRGSDSIRRSPSARVAGPGAVTRTRVLIAQEILDDIALLDASLNPQSGESSDGLINYY